MKAALIGEGGSDRALLPALRWLLQRSTTEPAVLEWVDTARFASGRSLKEKVKAALRVHPCDLLFVHRDADNQAPARRFQEIRSAAGQHPHVAVVPIRMTETWLLIDESAIRAVAGRPSGKEDLGLPAIGKLEQVSDPKATLHGAMRVAHGATGRRARRFRPEEALHRLADLVTDWSPLRQVPAFRRLETDTRCALETLGLPLGPS